MKAKKDKKRIEVEGLPMLYKLSEWLTVAEVLEIMDQKHPPALVGEGRLADMYELRTTRIGGTRVFFARDVKEMARDQLVEEPEDVQMGRTRLPEYNKVMERVKAERHVPWHEYVDMDGALKILVRTTRIDKDGKEVEDFPGVTSREGVYRHADFRGGSVKTVSVGRTHLYKKEDIRNVKYQQSVRAQRQKLTRLRAGLVSPAGA